MENLKKNTPYILGGLLLSIGAFFVAKKIYSNSYTELSKDELIEQLMKLDKVFNKLGSQSGFPTKEEYNKYSNKQLINMINTNIRATSLGSADNISKQQ